MQRWQDKGAVDNALGGSCENIGNITSKQSFAKMARPQHCENITFCLRKACKPVVAGNGAASCGCRAAVWLKKSAQNVTGRFRSEFLVWSKPKSPRPSPCGVQVLLYGCSGLSFATLAGRRCRRQCIGGNSENIQILHPNRVLQKRLALSIVRISFSA